MNKHTLVSHSINYRDSAASQEEANNMAQGKYYLPERETTAPAHVTSLHDSFTIGLST